MARFSLPSCCLVRWDSSGGSWRDEAGAVLAALGPERWAVFAQSGGGLPRAGCRGPPGRGRALPRGRGSGRLRPPAPPWMGGEPLSDGGQHRPARRGLRGVGPRRLDPGRPLAPATSGAACRPGRPGGSRVATPCPRAGQRPLPARRRACGGRGGRWGGPADRGGPTRWGAGRPPCDGPAPWPAGLYRPGPHLWGTRSSIAPPRPTPGGPRLRCGGMHDPRFQQPLGRATTLPVSASAVWGRSRARPHRGWARTRRPWAGTQAGTVCRSGRCGPALSGRRGSPRPRPSPWACGIAPGGRPAGAGVGGCGV